MYAPAAVVAGCFVTPAVPHFLFGDQGVAQLSVNKSGLHMQVRIRPRATGARSFDATLKVIEERINASLGAVVEYRKSPDLENAMIKYFNTDYDWELIMMHARHFEERQWGRKHSVTQVKMQGDNMRKVVSRIDDLVDDVAQGMPGQIVALLKELAATNEWRESIDFVDTRLMQEVEPGFFLILHTNFSNSDSKKGFSLFGINFSKTQVVLDFRILKMGIHNFEKLLAEKDQVYPPLSHAHQQATV